MVLFSLIVSPFLAYGFATVTKKDSDKIPVKILSPDGEVIPMMLSEAIAAKVPVERIVELTDVNLYCRWCGEPFHGNEPVCLSCQKKRVWFSLHARSNDSIRSIDINPDAWQNIPAGYRITGVDRRRAFE